jgi:purine-binding chemotaxis protein CheW
MSRVVAFGSGEIDAPPPFGAPIGADYLAGLGRLDERFVLLLDLDHALRSDVFQDLPAHPSPAGTDLPEVKRP